MRKTLIALVVSLCVLGGVTGAAVAKKDNKPVVVQTTKKTNDGNKGGGKGGEKGEKGGEKGEKGDDHDSDDQVCARGNSKDHNSFHCEDKGDHGHGGGDNEGHGQHDND